MVIFTAACSVLNTPEQVALVYEGAPRIEIASPLAGSVYRAGTPVNILARIDNAGADIARVEIRVGDELVAEGLSPNTAGAAAFTVTSSWVAGRSGLLTISVLVSRADGTASDLKTVDIEVRSPLVPTPTATVTLAPTNTPAEAAPAQPEQPAATTAPEQPAPEQPAAQPAQPTTPPEPTAIPPSATPDTPRVRVRQGANVRSGPGTVFDPAIGSLPAGAEADLLAQNPGASWYKIRYYNSEAWIAAITVDVLGNVAALPVEAGPPTPLPPPPTATPAPAATQTPTGGADLVVDGIPNINPHPFTCNQASEIYVNVRNNGTQASNPGRLTVQDFYKGNPSGSNTSGNFGVIQPGQSVTVGPLYLTVSTNINEAHTTRVIVDVENQTPESNEGNNQYNSVEYILAQGGC
ncbi:MAG: SH3 domain-containing protein [Anaerolineae bacterium]|nr:SH3 domain-containing protein [Anaerolineae bacterium]